MGLETGTKIADLNSNWPLGSDQKSQGDDHLRLIKAVLKGDALSLADGGNIAGDVEVSGTWTLDGSGAFEGVWPFEGLQVGPNAQGTADDVFVSGDAVIAAGDSMNFTAGRSLAAVFRWFNKISGNAGTQDADLLATLTPDGLLLPNDGARAIQVGGTGWGAGTPRMQWQVRSSDGQFAFEVDGGRSHLYFDKTAGGSPYRITYGGAASGTAILNRGDGDARYQLQSARRYKEQIAGADHAAALFGEIPPVTFTWGAELDPRSAKFGRSQLGMIADDAPAELQTFQRKTDADGNDLEEFEVLGLDPLAVSAVLRAKIAQQQDEIAELRGMVEGLIAVGLEGGKP